MNRYVLRDSEQEFLVEAHHMKQAKENAEYYSAIVIGKLHEPNGPQNIARDESCDWSLHTTE